MLHLKDHYRVILVGYEAVDEPGTMEEVEAGVREGPKTKVGKDSSASID